MTHLCLTPCAAPASSFDTFSGNQDDDLYESSQSSLSCYNTGTVLSRNTVNCSVRRSTSALTHGLPGFST